MTLPRKEFDGKYYDFHYQAYSKSRAEIEALSLQQSGKLAKVTKETSTAEGTEPKSGYIYVVWECVETAKGKTTFRKIRQWFSRS